MFKVPVEHVMQPMAAIMAFEAAVTIGIYFEQLFLLTFRSSPIVVVSL